MDSISTYYGSYVYPDHNSNSTSSFSRARRSAKRDERGVPRGHHREFLCAGRTPACPSRPAGLAFGQSRMGTCRGGVEPLNEVQTRRGRRPVAGHAQTKLEQEIGRGAAVVTARDERRTPASQRINAGLSRAASLNRTIVVQESGSVFVCINTEGLSDEIKKDLASSSSRPGALRSAPRPPRPAHNERTAEFATRGASSRSR